jgi:hypothetical protein
MIEKEKAQPLLREFLYLIFVNTKSFFDKNKIKKK